MFLSKSAASYPTKSAPMTLNGRSGDRRKPPRPPNEPVSAQSGLEAEDPYLKSLLGSGYSERMDAIEIATLKYVLDVCRTSASAAEAGRRLYNVSRNSRATANDSDRIAKFLKTYKLKFSQLQHA